MASFGSRRSGRGVFVLAVAAFGVLALSLSAVSAGKPLTKKRALKLFYRKSVADARFVNVGEKASDTELLDGKDSAAFLGTTEKAADADKLDGLDSTAFQQACEQGAVQAWAQIEPPVESTYSDVADGWSCAGVQIRVRQPDFGTYYVDFGGAELTGPCVPRITVISPKVNVFETVFGGTNTQNDSGGPVPNCVAQVDFFDDSGTTTDFEFFTIVLLSPVSELVVP